MESTLLDRVELFATRIITSEFSNRLVFHDISFVRRVINAIQEIGVEENMCLEDSEQAQMAGWFSLTGFRDLDKFEKMESPMDLFSQCQASSLSIAREFLTGQNVDEAIIEKVILLMTTGGPGGEPVTLAARILADAMTIDYSKPKALKRVKTLYEEFILTDSLVADRSTYYEFVLSYLTQHSYHTEYGKRELNQGKQKTISKIQKEKKELDKTEDQLIKRELDIQDAELKKLKKSLNSVKGRDDRGIQTLFRTTLKNHYTLNEMVDRKANIMISVNAIIISLIIGRILGQENVICIHNAPILFLLFTSTISIFHAILAIRPNSYHGKFTEEQVRNKQGNLLFFGNFHKMAFRDYEWGMLQMLNDGNYLYMTMIRDIYFLGQELAKKYLYIRKSLFAFLLGLIVSAVSFLILSNFSDDHLAERLNELIGPGLN